MKMVRWKCHGDRHTLSPAHLHHPSCQEVATYESLLFLIPSAVSSICLESDHQPTSHCNVCLLHFHPFPLAQRTRGDFTWVSSCCCYWCYFNWCCLSHHLYSAFFFDWFAAQEEPSHLTHKWLVTHTHTYRQRERKRERKREWRMRKKRRKKEKEKEEEEKKEQGG